jgi:hypothetical protein
MRNREWCQTLIIDLNFDTNQGCRQLFNMARPLRIEFKGALYHIWPGSEAIRN